MKLILCIEYTLKMVGDRLNATAGRAVMNSFNIRLRISAGGKMSHVMIGMIRPKRSASRSVPRFILRRVIKETNDCCIDQRTH